MYRALPEGNKILCKRWNDKNRQHHLQKLKEMKPTLQTRRYNDVFATMDRKAKRERMQEERYTEIERENRILLSKMTDILQNRKPPRPGDQGMNGKRSLNRESRKKELIKITMENQAILRRLQGKQAVHDRSQLKLDFDKRKVLLKNICQYPYQLATDRKSASAFNSSNVREVSTAHLYPSPTHSRISSNRKLQPLANRALNKERVILYKNGRELEAGYFVIEISTYQRMLYITAFDPCSPESMVVEIEEDKAHELLSEFNHNYESLTNHLEIMDKKLVVLNPNQSPKKKHQSKSAGNSKPWQTIHPIPKHKKRIFNEKTSPNKNRSHSTQPIPIRKYLGSAESQKSERLSDKDRRASDDRKSSDEPMPPETEGPITESPSKVSPSPIKEEKKENEDSKGGREAEENKTSNNVSPENREETTQAVISENRKEYVKDENTVSQRDTVGHHTEEGGEGPNSPNVPNTREDISPNAA